jgi:hypothetical protein
MLVKFREERAPADFIYAFEKTGNFVTRENRDEWSAQDLNEWDGLLQAYRRRVAMEGRIIDLCFRLRPESARSEISRHTRFAAAEFGGCCSFRSRTGDQLVCSGTDLSGSLLDSVLRKSGASDREWDPTDHHRFDHLDMASVRGLWKQSLSYFADTSRSLVFRAAIEKRIAKIGTARATPDTWFGRLPAPGQDGDREKAVLVDEMLHAVRLCEEQGAPQDVIESMLLRSWIRMLFFNDREDERIFHLLDRYWSEVHATFQLHMAGYSGLRVQ